jgi:hypothetical protein
VTTRATHTPEVKATAAGRAATGAAELAGVLTAGPAGAVAVGGFGSHPDKDVRLAVSRSTVVPATGARARSRRSRWTAASGGGFAGYYGGSSSSCSSGGGGSSCGGGGGGCGGGGGGGCGG